MDYHKTPSILRSPSQLRHNGWYVPIYPCGHPDGFCMTSDYPQYRNLWRSRACQWCDVRRGEQDRVYRLDRERVN
jgi:hypothetical protein